MVDTKSIHTHDREILEEFLFIIYLLIIIKILLIKFPFKREVS